MLDWFSACPASLHQDCGMDCGSNCSGVLLFALQDWQNYLPETLFEASSIIVSGSA